MEIDSGLPNGRHFAFGELLGKAPQVTKGACSWLGPTSSGSFTPVSLRGPAAIRHPWRGAALAASMRLGPLRETCVQPAPKSRLAVTGPCAYEDQKQIKSFPAEAGPTGGAAGPTDGARCAFLVGPASAGKRPFQAPSILYARAAVSGTGFSREGASSGATSFKGSTLDRSHVLRRNASRDAPRHPGSSGIHFPGVSVRRCLP